MKISATLTARLDAQEQRIERLEREGAERSRSIHELDKQLSLASNEIERLGQRGDEVRTHRWEIWKILLVWALGVISAFIPFALTRLIR